MLGHQVFDYFMELQYEKALNDDELMAILMAFAWINREDLEEMVETVEKLR